MSSDRLEAFTAWLDEIENYSTRYERFLDDVNMATAIRHLPRSQNTLIAWLKAAFEQGAEHERQKTSK